MRAKAVEDGFEFAILQSTVGKMQMFELACVLGEKLYDRHEVGSEWPQGECDGREAWIWGCGGCQDVVYPVLGCGGSGRVGGRGGIGAELEVVEGIMVLLKESNKLGGGGQVSSIIRNGEGKLLKTRESPQVGEGTGEVEVQGRAAR